VDAAAAQALLGRADVALVDLRERAERERHGCIPGALHAPYPGLVESLAPGGMLFELANATGKRLVFFCAYGERSAMAVQAAQDAGLKDACHIEGGMGAWKKVVG
jgi:sulfur dioxygenase